MTVIGKIPYVTLLTERDSEVYEDTYLLDTEIHYITS